MPLCLSRNIEVQGSVDARNEGQYTALQDIQSTSNVRTVDPFARDDILKIVGAVLVGSRDGPWVDVCRYSGRHGFNFHSCEN